MRKETLSQRVNSLVKEEKAMRVGDRVRIIKCNPMPEVVGQQAEIVDLQTQAFERYRVYPVWVRMLTGERQSKVYGFHYTEVKLIPREAKPITALEEILKGVTRAEDLEEIETVTKSLIKKKREVRVGDMVTITNCLPMPDLAGERAEIVDLQTQAFERYRIYPVWLKVSSGERKGKVYGFQLDEIDWLAKHGVRSAGYKIVKTRLAAEIERIIGNADRSEEIAEIERAISEAKGKIILEPAQGFWEGRTPCWEMLHCPEVLRNKCLAFRYLNLPCWQIRGTYNTPDENGVRCDCSSSICEHCRVYKRYGTAKLETKVRTRRLDNTTGLESKGAMY